MDASHVWRDRSITVSFRRAVGGAEEREHSPRLQELLTVLTGEPGTPVLLSRNGSQFGSFIVDEQKAVELKTGSALWD